MASPTPTEVPSELPHRVRPRGLRRPGRGPGDHPHRPADRAQPHSRLPSTTARPLAAGPPASTNGALQWVNPQIGRASCRERVCQYVEISVVDVSSKKKK